MDAAEKYVRQRYPEVRLSHDFDGWSIFLHEGMCEPIGVFRLASKAAARQAAYEFTLAREEAIRQVREEIAELQDDTSAYARGEYLGEVYRRILAREQAHLDSLLVGWKGK